MQIKNNNYFKNSKLIKKKLINAEYFVYHYYHSVDII